MTALEYLNSKLNLQLTENSKVDYRGYKYSRKLETKYISEIIQEMEEYLEHTLTTWKPLEKGFTLDYVKESCYSEVVEKIVLWN